MGRRSQIYQRLPWTGGINSSVDPGVLPDNDLTIADNVIFSTSASRLKRDGFEYLDTAIPAVTHRSSSGTTRTLVFASSVNIASPADAILVSGEKITVTGAGASTYNCSGGTISSITTTTVTNDTINYTFGGATSVAEGSTADTAATVTKYSKVIGLLDMWHWDTGSSIKVQKIVAITDQPKIFYYDINGRRVELTAAGGGATALTGTITSCDLRVFNEMLIMSFSGSTNTPKKWNPNGGTTTWVDLTGSPPNFSIMQEHLGRLWTNDKADSEKLHYSATFDETIWQGVGDSGALFLSTGDGDPTGISAIFPPFKGALFVGKGTKLRRVLGDAPENFMPESVSDGLGVVSHKAVVAADMDDVAYISRRGIHSLAATDTTGDFESSFLSKKIQPDFASWQQSRLPYIQGAWVPSLNSMAFSVAEEGNSTQNAVWLFNAEHKEWHRWPDLFAQSLTTMLGSDSSTRLLLGTSDGRLAMYGSGDYTDFGTDAIVYRIKTGAIHATGNLQAVCMFKKLTFFYKPRGNYSFTANFTVDNHSPQAVVFAQSSGGDKLGDTFVLATSALGTRQVLAPFSQPVGGIGRGFTLEVLQSDTEGEVEIYGFAVEYEVADVAQEVDNGAGVTE